MNILMILTSHDALGDTGKKSGFWLQKFAAPYYAFSDAGAKVTLASPKGGQPPIDASSNAPDAQTDDTRLFRCDAAARAALAATTKLTDLQVEGFDAVSYAGGHGPLWDLTEDLASINLIEYFVSTGRSIGAVCHAPAVFRGAKGVDGKPLVSGRNVTGFANTEEAAAGLTDVVPFLVQDLLVTNGGHYSNGADWAPHVVVDGNLVTGQNPASSKEAAEALIKLLRYGGWPTPCKPTPAPPLRNSTLPI